MTDGLPAGADAGLALCVLVTDFDTPSGGIPRQTRNLLAELRRRGSSAFVCCRNYHGRPRDGFQDGYRIHRTPAFGRTLPGLNSLLYLADGLLWLVRHRKRYDVILCQQMFGAAMLGLLAKVLLGKPVLVRVTSTGALGEADQVRTMRFSALRLKLLRRVDRWVALTPPMRDEVLTLGVAADRVAVIPNAARRPGESAADPSVRRRRRAGLGLDARPLAVYTGRLSSEKGLDTLLHAWRALRERLPDARLFILGEGGAYRNVEGDLRALHGRLGLGTAVEFLGYVPDVSDHLLAADVFVLPTRVEGMSNSLVEAMMAGCAVVTTDIPANRELIDDGVEGLLVPVDDPAALAAALGRVLETPGLGDRLGAAARTRAERGHSIPGIVDRYVVELRRAIDGHENLPPLHGLPDRRLRAVAHRDPGAGG